jgi:hypothetical protein
VAADHFNSGTVVIERVPYKLSAIVAFALAAYASGACADERDTPMFLFSGFGTLGVVHSSESKADFTATPFKPTGAGHTHAWSADVDSLIAGQVTADLTPQLSAVLQLMAEQNDDNSYRPHVEWANIKYQFTPDLSVRFGRTTVPIFMVSDTRKVGYSNPWVRPPIELYDVVPVTSNDGVDASYRTHVGAATNTFQVTGGRSDTDFPGGSGFGAGTAKSREQLALADTFEVEFATVHLNYGQARVTISQFGALFDAFRQFGPQGVAIADKYDVDKTLVTFLGIGVGYDPGNWFVMGEWGREDAHSVLGVKTGWYVSGGYRFGKVTPYVTYARTKGSGNSSDPGLTVSALPPPLAGVAAGLNAALNSLLSAKVTQNTVSVGGRWDFMKNAAFKLQLDHMGLAAGSAGTLINLQPDFVPGGKVNVFSATFDFVF